MNFIKEIKFQKGKAELLDYLPDMGIGPVREEIVKGLLSVPKRIPSKFFYDAAGSELFEEITRLEEYYPTRTEKQIISTQIKNLNLDFKNLHIVELGSGDASKISLLLEQVPPGLLKTIHYFPVDISRPAIEKAMQNLMQKFDLKGITGVVADFFHQMNVIPDVPNRLFCFFGSTIGNFTPSQAQAFMYNLRKIMHKGDTLLLGIDRVKDIDILEKAYNDGKGITARFNKNILNVVNSLVHTDFHPNDFEHVAFFNRGKNRIEMHLRALKNMEISLGDNKKIFFEKGELVHTENSQKFTSADIRKIADWASLEVQQVLSDPNLWFSLVYYKVV